MATWGKRLGWGLAITVGLVGAAYAGAVAVRARTLAKVWEVPRTVDFPVPFPLDLVEVVELGSGADHDGVAMERAVQRGRRLIQTRLGCFECHGPDLAGGVMIDSAPMGSLYGPNITAGGVTKGWGPADWDRIVRHGIMHDGHTSVMPAIDYARLSDRELSDVIAYARSVPSSDKVMPPLRFGPLLNLLVATGQITTAASVIDHAAVPSREPPPAEPNVAFGQHIAEGCKGCHGRTFSGGPIEGGDPSWPAASNLTPTGLADASFEDFDAALRHGKTRRGERMPPPMPWQAYAGMTDVEVQALWAFFRSLPPMETGAR